MPKASLRQVPGRDQFVILIDGRVHMQFTTGSTLAPCQKGRRRILVGAARPKVGTRDVRDLRGPDKCRLAVNNPAEHLFMMSSFML
jgi:hypothetical protein